MQKTNTATISGVRARSHARLGARQGFTLVEVLVVLAILVILFGLLFAPMMAGMDMATRGQVQSRLQDVARRAAEEMRRELTNAIYVYPPPSYPVGTTAVTDYSQVAFVPAETSSDGTRQPRMFTRGGQSEYLVVRYFVKPPDLSGGKVYDETNPFKLVRQEGVYRWDDALLRYVFGRVNATSGAFEPGVPIVENAVTPDEDYDVPATTTICLDDETMHVGYLDKCPDGSTNLVYLHDDVKFQPARIVGEALTASRNNTTYEARYGNWMGSPSSGLVAQDAPLSQTESQLQPRLALYRWSGNAHKKLELDTYSSVPAKYHLRWNSATGTVHVGDWHTVRISVDVSATPTGDQFYPLQVLYGGRGTAPYAGDSYDETGAGPATPNAPVEPIYANRPQQGEPRVPIAYRIHPERSDGTGEAAKVVPQSLRVTVVGTAAGQMRRAQFTPAQEIRQSDLGAYEFSEFMPANQLWAEARLSRYSPPSPDQFGSGLEAFDIYISYYYRRNFYDNPPAYRDDVMYADYSTAEIINITLIPQRFTELQPYRDGEPNLVVPPDLPVGGVPIRTQAVLLSAKR